MTVTRRGRYSIKGPSQRSSSSVGSKWQKQLDKDTLVRDREERAGHLSQPGRRSALNGGCIDEGPASPTPPRGTFGY